MRAHIKAGDKWVIEELPSDPMGLYRWLCKHDGEQVVVADDEHKVYYCAREKELELYREKGKKAEMFIVLADLLWANMPAMQQSFDLVNAVFPDAKVDAVGVLE